jgi:hypothetical protein
MRFVALVDPQVADIEALAREMAAAVEAEHERNPRTKPLNSVVLPSCFPKADLDATYRDASEDVYSDRRGRLGQPCRAVSGVDLDSRVHLDLSADDRAFGQRMGRKYGPMLAIGHELVCGGPHA